MSIDSTLLDLIRSADMRLAARSPHDQIPFLRSAGEGSILEVEQDIFQDNWHIYEWRPTSFGFAVKLGRPCQFPKIHGRAGSKVVLTSEVVDYLIHAEQQQKRNMLPLTSTAIKRLRRLLDLDFQSADLEYYYTRIVELSNLSPESFASNYNQPVEAVARAKFHIHGDRHHQPNWWSEPEPAGVLGANLPLAHKADVLNLSIAAVRKLSTLVQTKTP